MDASHDRDLHAFTGSLGIGAGAVAGLAAADVSAGGTVEANPSDSQPPGRRRRGGGRLAQISRNHALIWRALPGILRAR